MGSFLSHTNLAINESMALCEKKFAPLPFLFVFGKSIAFCSVVLRIAPVPLCTELSTVLQTGRTVFFTFNFAGWFLEQLGVNAISVHGPRSTPLSITLGADFICDSRLSIGHRPPASTEVDKRYVIFIEIRFVARVANRS